MDNSKVNWLEYDKYMDLSEEIEHVHKVMNEHPNAHIRHWACRLGWIHPNGRPQAWRVHRALLRLALEGRATMVQGKWKPLP